MNPLSLDEVTQYVEENISTFHNQRIQSLNKLELIDVLKRKNPYLFKAKYLASAGEIVKSIADAHISSNEETIFGDWLEGLAIFINKRVYNGHKSTSNGMDLEFEKDGTHYVVTIKSGPNWANSNQTKAMLSNFTEAKRRLATSGNKSNVKFVNGCCYGRDNNPHKIPQKGLEYYKYCGQLFWEFISGDDSLYTKIIEPLGYKAKERNEEFMKSYHQKLNVFSHEFTTNFCNTDGSINWDKIIELNSSKDAPIKSKKPRPKKAIQVAGDQNKGSSNISNKKSKSSKVKKKKGE